MNRRKCSRWTVMLLDWSEGGILVLANVLFFPFPIVLATIHGLLFLITITFMGILLYSFQLATFGCWDGSPT